MKPNVCYVISDLHLADGGALDDFVDDDLFARWLSSLNAASSTLVINGDWLAFEQIEPLAVPEGTPSTLLWTEEHSVEKMQHCIDAHPVFFNALESFHAAGGSIVVTVGNHDIDFVWSGVQELTAQRMAAVGSERVAFETVGTSFADVWIQHGHQFDLTNSTRDPEHFVHIGPDGKQYLERIWGTDFVLEIFNPLHSELEFAANLKPQWQVVLQGLKHRWLGWRHFVRAVAFIARRGIPVTALADIVLDGDEQPDLAWLDSYFSDEATALIIRSAIDELGPEQANLLGLDGLDSDLIAALNAERPVTLTPADLGAPELDEANGETTLGLFRDRGEVRGAREALALGFNHVVLGHTHHMVDGEELGGGALLFNPGTWIPHIDMKNPEVIEARRADGISKNLLNNGDFYATEIYAVEIVDDGSRPRVICLEGFRAHD